MSIHYICPYSTVKNIGGAINDAIEQIAGYPRDAENDWIVLTDHDMMWLLPDTKAHVEEILLSDNVNFDIMGCLTNRIRSKEQLYGNIFNQDDRIREHIKIAGHCWKNGENTVKPAQGSVAAFMMCFKVSTYHKIGGFDQDCITFDRRFCDEARRHGMSIGIMQGIYVWHSYRLMSAKPFNECNHLIK